MLNVEFSSEFDVVFNYIMSNQAPSLDEYEKSVFLTQAQEQLLKSKFQGITTPVPIGYDGSAKRQAEFSNLIRVIKPSTASASVSIDTRSSKFTYPDDVMFITGETVILQSGQVRDVLQVVPIAVEEYTRLMAKPYKGPNIGQAWRLLNFSNNQRVIEVIPSSSGTIDYTLIYVKKPNPIILTDLTNMGISINGLVQATECELDEVLHREILERACELAKVYFTGNAGDMVQINTRSE